MNINLLVVDLSHWDPAQDYNAVSAAGVCGVVYKATQGTGYRDSTYLQQRKAALKAGLLWGAYHFGDGSDPGRQVDNFLGYAQIDDQTLFCLDWEDNSSSQMKLEGARKFIDLCEQQLGRLNQCVLYSGNTAKDALGNKVDPFFGTRRLWLAQYGNAPVCQASWDTYWLWQYTDGQYGPEPHTVDGCSPDGIDCNHYDGTPEELAAEWASGAPVPPQPPPPSDLIVTITINAPPGVTVKVNQYATSE
jgi:GH25 family lysozyme M1 (1,4-beta-N-acetylmuramidase)